MLTDPIELYTYPKEWYSDKREAERRVYSGFYILKPDRRWLKRGITTATTAAAAINASIVSIFEDIEYVEVRTPIGLEVNLKVEAKNGEAEARKFSGDHAFDVTDGLIFRSHTVEGRKGLFFGKGVGVKKQKQTAKEEKAVSESALSQLKMNLEFYCRQYDYSGGVFVEVPEGETVAKKTRNPDLGIVDGISILGSTGFVEPWSDELLKTKLEIARQYNKIAVATGRTSWKYALENFPEFQPFVFGVYIDEAIKGHEGEKILIGLPKLLHKWAGERSDEAVAEKAKARGVNEVIILNAR